MMMMYKSKLSPPQIANPAKPLTLMPKPRISMRQVPPCFSWTIGIWPPEDDWPMISQRVMSQIVHIDRDDRETRESSS